MKSIFAASFFLAVVSVCQAEPKACQLLTTLQVSTILDSAAVEITTADESHNICTYGGKGIKVLIVVEKQAEAAEPPQADRVAGLGDRAFAHVGGVASQVKVIKGDQSFSIVAARQPAPTKEQMIKLAAAALPYL